VAGRLIPGFSSPLMAKVLISPLFLQYGSVGGRILSFSFSLGDIFPLLPQESGGKPLHPSPFFVTIAGVRPSGFRRPCNVFLPQGRYFPLFFFPGGFATGGFECPSLFFLAEPAFINHIGVVYPFFLSLPFPFFFSFSLPLSRIRHLAKGRYFPLFLSIRRSPRFRFPNLPPFF